MTKNISKVSLCTGCASCANICPQKAIIIEQNKEGFYIPKVDNNKCNQCGLCKKICPQCVNIDLNIPIKAFAIKANDDIREKSSSGGVFRILAESVFSMDGVVCGAAFSSDFNKVEHIIIEKLEDLYKLQGSKYLQSYIDENLYKNIKEFLEKGVQVLFSGTSCQIAGLKSFLQKDYEKLFLVDILCHGAPSPKVWANYITGISNGKKVVEANFRDKKFGWGFNHTLTVEFSNGTEYAEKRENSLFYKAFLEDLILNRPCYECKYANYSRAGDISLGDFWSVYRYDSSLDDKKGISLVLVNSNKGLGLFEKSKSRYTLIQELSHDEAKDGNSILAKPFSPHRSRKQFFENIDKINVFENIKQSFSNKYDGIISNFWWSNNFGAIISAFAIQDFFKSNGYNYHLLNHIPYGELNSNFESFRDKYLYLTHEVNSQKDFDKLNKGTNNFVVGTDQVFRWIYIRDNLPAFLLTRTNFNKKRIAFSASFGKAEFDEAGKKEKRKIKMFLKRFYAISTREKSGIKLCKDNFNIQAEHIIDPIFYVEQEKWDKIVENVDLEINPVVTYVLDMDEKAKNLSEVVGLKYVEKITRISIDKTTPEEFIYAIKNAKCVVTDSFHGVCLSIIFNKPFICLINKERGADRFNSIQKTFNIKSGFVDKESDLENIDELLAIYDYSYVQKVIAQEKEKARVWLYKNLNKRSFSIRKIPNEIVFQIKKCLKDTKIKIKDARKKIKEKFEKNKGQILRKVDLKFKEFRFLKLLYYSKNKLLLWGASLFLEYIVKKYHIKNEKIVGIIDANPKRQGKKLGKYAIYAPNDITNLDFQEIVITIVNNADKREAEIREFLNEKNLKDIEITGLSKKK